MIAGACRVLLSMLRRMGERVGAFRHGRHCSLEKKLLVCIESTLHCCLCLRSFRARCRRSLSDRYGKEEITIASSIFFFQTTYATIYVAPRRAQNMHTCTCPHAWNMLYTNMQGRTHITATRLYYGHFRMRHRLCKSDTPYSAIVSTL